MEWLLKNKLKNQQGFNMVELMIVAVIISILVVIAVPAYRLSVDNAQLQACKANQRVLNGAVVLYRVQYEKFPETLNDLKGMAYLMEIPRCPTDGKEYNYNKNTGHITCNLEGH